MDKKTKTLRGLIFLFRFLQYQSKISNFLEKTIFYFLDEKNLSIFSFFLFLVEKHCQFQQYNQIDPVDFMQENIMAYLFETSKQ